MPKQSRYVLQKMLETVEADLFAVGLQAQLLRHLAYDKPSRRLAGANRPNPLGLKPGRGSSGHPGRRQGD